MSAITSGTREGAGRDTRVGRFWNEAAEEALAGALGQRIVAPRWSDRETVTDRSRRAQLERLQELVRYVRGERLR